MWDRLRLIAAADHTWRKPAPAVTVTQQRPSVVERDCGEGRHPRARSPASDSEARRMTSFQYFQRAFVIVLALDAAVIVVASAAAILFM
jgi:hypothetical protein